MTTSALSRPELAHALGTLDELGPRFSARAARNDRDARFPRENFHELRQAGLLALCVPERHGGLGAGFADSMHFNSELARHCPTTALAFNMHCQAALWSGPLADDLDMTDSERARHEQARERLFRGIVENGDLINQPLSEGRGEDTRVRAVPVDGGFRLTGRKPFATMCEAASAYYTGGYLPGENAFRVFLVRATNPGAHIEGDWDAVGMRASDSRTLRLDDAFVPAADELLPAGGFGQLSRRWPHIFMTLTPTYLGLMSAVVELVQASLPVEPSPAKQCGWAEILIAYECARALWERAVEEAGVDPAPAALRRALAATYTVLESAAQVSSMAMRVCGSGSVRRELTLERHFRDARCGSLMGPWSADGCIERLGRLDLGDPA